MPMGIFGEPPLSGGGPGTQARWETNWVLGSPPDQDGSIEEAVVIDSFFGEGDTPWWVGFPNLPFKN